MDLVTLAAAKSYINKKINEREPGANVTGATVGQIVEIATVDGTGRPTAWKAVDKPTKLSDLKNDLFYANATEALTLTKADFIPKYVLDEDGNPTEEIESYYYKSTPALDWFTSPDKIGFIIQFTYDDESETINHHVPNVTAQWDDSQWTYSGYFDEEGPSAPFIVCDECGLGIANEANILNDDGPIPENAFYIQVFDWWDETGVNFDSITIYQIDSKKISKELYDHSDIDEQISELRDGLDDAFNYTNSVEQTANKAKTTADKAQTTANAAQTTANNAQTAANNAQTAANANATQMLVLKTTPATLPSSKPWNSIAYGAGKFAALNCGGSYDARLVALSEDGVNWSESNAIPISNGVKWTKIIYTGEIFIVAGMNQNSIYTSTDGITWSKRVKLNDTFNCGGIGYGDGRVIMVSSASNQGYCFTDPDKGGITNLRSFTMDSSIQSEKDVAYGDGKFVIATGSGIEYITFDNSGALSRNSALNVTTNCIAVVYDADKFVAVGKKSLIFSDSVPIVYSTDGITWSKATDVPDKVYYDVAYGAGKFVAVANETIIYSADGITWSTATDVPKLPYRGIAYGAGEFVAVANNSNSAVYSKDGITWSTEYTGIYQNNVDVTNTIKRLCGTTMEYT